MGCDHRYRKGGRNTDGIDPGNSTNVTITHCFIRAGDDNVAIKAGAPGPTKNITISHNHFYYGHGMSIGSETDGGASAIRVTDLSIEGADNGIRIKSNSSRGGLVHDVVYEDVCIKDTTNPIYMDSNYSYRGEATDKLPVFQDITLRNVRLIGAGKITLAGFDATHRLGMLFDNVFLDSPAAVKVRAGHGEFVLGPGIWRRLGKTSKWSTLRGSPARTPAPVSSSRCQTESCARRGTPACRSRFILPALNPRAAVDRTSHAAASSKVTTCSKITYHPNGDSRSSWKLWSTNGEPAF